MGAVYLAHDEQLDRQVALKIPTAKVAGSPKLLERLHREARSAAVLSHANICQVFDVGEIDGYHFISMAFVDGRPLSDFIRPGKRLPERQAASLVRRVSLALAHAHENGVIHRDLKPSNIMVNAAREPIVMDFGLARQFDKDADSRLTQQGGVLGSPAYMSPEQVDGDIDRIGPASDIYSLGVVLYELLTARLPFEGSMAAIMGQILTSEPTPPSELRLGLSSRLEEICLKMMAREVDDRYTSMGQVAAALTEALKQTRLSEATARESVELPAFGGGDDEYEFLSQRREVARRTLWLEKSRRFWIGATVVGLFCVMGVWLGYRLTGGGPIEMPLTGEATIESSQEAVAPRQAPGEDPEPVAANEPPLQVGPSRRPPAAVAPFNANKARQLQQAWADYLGIPSETTNSIGMKFKLIPPGEFLMGSPDSDSDARSDEKPQHLVKITTPFYLSEKEVSQQEYEKVMGSNPSHFKGQDHPVEQVTWDDSRAFCRTLTANPREVTPGRMYVLPTEAEWEYACRAGTDTTFVWGESPNKQGLYAWAGLSADLRTHPVGEKLANPWGLFDIVGNVWEWTSDRMGANYYGTSPGSDPLGPGVGSLRVIRGAGWANNVTSSMRSANRGQVSGEKRRRRSGFIDGRSDWDVGFRVAFRITNNGLPGTNRSIDLLAMLNPKRDFLDSRLQFLGRVLFTPRWETKNAIAMIPYKPVPAEYDINIELERKGDDRFGFDFGIVMGGQQAVISMDGSGVPAWCLDRIDGLSIRDAGNPTRRLGKRFSIGQKRHVLIRVRSGRVTAVLDGETIFDWVGQPSQLTLWDRLELPDANSLFFYSQAAFAVHEMTLTPISNFPQPDRSRTSTSGRPTLSRVLAAENSLTRDTHPWVSADGLTVYWDRGVTIWSASRVSPNSPFGQAFLVVPGRHPTVSGDLLELIMLRVPDSVETRAVLGVSTRTTPREPFGTVKVIPELRNQASVKSPALSHDGLSLVFERGVADQKKFVISRRANRQSRWGTPTPLLIRPGIYGNKPLTWAFTTLDGRVLFCCYGGGKNNVILVGRRDAENQPFARFETIEVDNRLVRGRSPRYVESTGELFFSAVPSQQSENWELRVIRNYRP
jgi:formylglycine-generating enzyme required for sulfatase activity